MCRILADIHCGLDSCSDVGDVLCLPLHSFSPYWTRIVVLLCYLPLCRASVKLSTCICEEIPVIRQRGLRLPTTLCVTTLGRVCVVYPPRLSISCLHLDVVCHAVSLPRNSPLVNIALILSFHRVSGKYKTEAGVLSSYQAYSADARGAPSLAAPSN